MWRVVDIGGENFFIHVHHRKMVVEKDGSEVSSIPISDIHSVILHGDGFRYSDTFIKLCMENNVPIVFCDNKHLPIGMLMTLNQKNESSRRFEEQFKASLPRKKQAWKKVVSAKLAAQGSVLNYYGYDTGFAVLDHLSKTVLSGDSTNREAVGAKEYFKYLFGSSYFRSSNSESVNSLLDYVYTVIRSTVARGIMGVGLHPGLSVFHSNKINPFALADDLMEPLRPIGDALVIDIIKDNGQCELIPEVKRNLVKITNIAVKYEDVSLGLSNAVGRYVMSYYSFISGRSSDISFPVFSGLPE